MMKQITKICNLEGIIATTIVGASALCGLSGQPALASTGTAISLGLIYHKVKALHEHQQAFPEPSTPPEIKAKSLGKTIVIIDGANTYISLQEANLVLDYGKLAAVLVNGSVTHHGLWFVPGVDPKLRQHRPFMEHLESLGYKVVTSDGHFKSNQDSAITYEIMKLADGDEVETIVLISGDADFLPALKFAMDKGKKVKVISLPHSTSRKLSTLPNWQDLTELEGVCSPKPKDSSLKRPRRPVKNTPKPVKKKRLSLVSS